MATINYQIEFYSNWHCGSGLSASADIDNLVIKDRDGLPFVPGRTIKGLLREAVQILLFTDKLPQDTLTCLFGCEGNKEYGKLCGVSYTNATISQEERESILMDKNLRHGLFMTFAATSIDENGLAIEHSLRRIETTIPCKLHGAIMNVPEHYTGLLIRAFKLIKRMGVGRNRGYGRCKMTKEV